MNTKRKFCCEYSIFLHHQKRKVNKIKNYIRNDLKRITLEIGRSGGAWLFTIKASLILEFEKEKISLKGKIKEINSDAEVFVISEQA